MLIIVPLVCFTLLLLAFSWGTNDADHSRRWRGSFVSAAVVWAFLLTASTELLSAFQLLAHPWTLMFWLLACAGCLFCAVGIKRRNRPISGGRWPTLSLSGLVLLAGVGLIVAVVGIIALVAPPNGWDSMVYHMSRSAHWIQNRTVAHYPTHIYRQLNSAPWAEFAITQFQILSGGDRLANLVQWFAMLGSVVAASLVGAHLGADSRGQLFAAVICSTIPMGIAQASGTQNDYLVAFWLISFVYYALLIAENGISFAGAALAGSSLGLALLTKGTAYLFIPPLAVWSAFIILRGRRVRLAPAIALVPAIVLILNAPFWLRNLEVFADPLGRHGGLKSQLLTLPALVSGLLRNASLHLATPSSQVNSWIHAAIVGAHQVIGIGAADGRTTFLTLAFSEPRWSTSDYKTGNLFHLLLVCMAARACWMLPSLRKDWRLISYLLALFNAFVLFSLLLKWQPIHSRLQLPLFGLAAPAVGRILGASSDHRPALLVCAVLVAASTPWLFGTSTRPVFGPNSVFTVDRSYQYFSGRSQLRHSYAEAVDLVSSKRCANVGLVIGSDSWEYPLWPLLRRNGEAEARVEHVKCREPLTRQSDHRLVSCV